MTEQEALNALAEKIANATGKICEAPVIPETDGTVPVPNCEVKLDVVIKNKHVTTMLALCTVLECSIFLY